MPPADPYWECIRHESWILSQQNSSLRPLPPGVFEPGDFAYIRGGLHQVFSEYLESKSYRLLPAEQRQYGETGRYCVVLKRLGTDRYLVCYLATFGGATSYHHIRDPVGRYFGFPLVENIHWPGVLPLRTDPPWRSASGGAYILGIPVVREGLQRSNLLQRYRLTYPDMIRLRNLMSDRDQEFYRHAEEIRRGHLDWMSMTLANHLPVETFNLPEQAIAGAHEKKIHERKHYARWMTMPTQQHHLSWLLRHMRHDICNRSIYLHSLTPKKRPRPDKFPKPFFASCLRVSVATIARLIR